MLATHLGAHTHPPMMADDSMEISSEYGQQGRDEEIDIDIDFGTAPADEDYAIEDAASNAGFEDGLQPQASPAVGNDDVMIDEDQHSYAMADEDFILDDDDQKMEQEAATMSFAISNSSSSFAAVGNCETLQGPELPSTGEAGIMWDEPELPKSTADEKYLLGDSEQAFHQEEDFAEQPEHEDNNNELDIEAPTKLPSEHGSQTSTPQNGTPHSGTAQEPRSPATSFPGEGAFPPEHISKDFTPKSSPHSTIGRTDKSTNFVSANDVSNFTAAPEITVVYQSSNYTLFSKTESDDPDSFFLSDTSILEKPLVDFFNVMRDVIQDDLGDEEELCMSVEDLGLELEENSTSAQAATLDQIISLHETVLRNDGVESYRPLSMFLGTRINFSKRLANLMAGAAEGKGLSDLVSWDDGSEGVDESEVVNESIHDNEASLENDMNGEVSYHETADGFVVESNHASSTPPASVHDRQEEVEHVKNTEEQQRVNAKSTAEHPSSGNNDPKDSRTSMVSNSAKNDTTNDVYGEDEEDLIDYSDEEAQEPEIQSHGAGTLHTDDTRTQDAEESLLEQPIENQSHHADGESEQPPPADEEAVVSNDDNAAHELDAEPDNLTAEDILGSAEHVDYGDELQAGDEPEQDQNEGQDPNTGLPLGQDGYADESVLQYHENTELETENTNLLGQEHADLNDSSEASNFPPDTLEFGDTAESSVTVSADDQKQGEEDLGEYDLDDSKDTGEAHTLENVANGANAEPEDEIDYEDDEEDKDLASNGVSAPLPTANDPLVTTGKRSRSDAEADDTSRGKEAKRPRSRS